MLWKKALSTEGEQQIEKLLDYILAKERNEALKLLKEKKHEESERV